MKKYIKALSCVLSIVLLVASVSVGGYSVSAEDAVSGSTLPVWTNEFVVEEFGSGYNLASGGPFSAYGGVKIENFTVSDGRLKGTYPSGSGSNGYTWAASIISPEADDIGVKFDVDTTESTGAVKFRLLLSLTGSGYLQPADGTVAYLIPEEGTASTVTIDGGSIFTVPMDFKGSVALCFNAFFDGANDTLKNEKLYELSELTFQLRAFDVPADNTVLYFDNISYISNTAFDEGVQINRSDVTITGKAGWRDGNKDATPLFSTNSNITLNNNVVTSTYPYLTGNRMFTNLQLGTDGTFESTDKVLSIDVDASAFESTSPKLQIRINYQDKSDYYSIMSAGTTLNLKCEDGTVIRAKATDYGNSKGNYINIPECFKGTVYVNLSAFGSSVYDYAKITVSCIVIDTNEDGKSISYSNVCYYGKTELPWNYSETIHDFSTSLPAPSAWGTNNTAGSSGYNKPTLEVKDEKLTVNYAKSMGAEMTWELKLGTGLIFKETDKAFGMDIDASALTYSPKLQIKFRQQNGSNQPSYHRLPTDKTVYFVKEDGTIETATVKNYGNNKGGYVSVPVGFKGTIVCGLEDFTDTNVETTVYDITNITLQTLIIDVNESSVITYDNIRYFGSETGSAAGLWFGVADANKAKKIDSTMNWLNGELGVLEPSKCVATSSGYVYAVDITDALTEEEYITNCYINGSKYNLVRKAVNIGDTVSLEGALILCGDSVYFGNSAPIRFGDCNSNKTVDIRDLVRLQKYLASPDDTNIYEKAAEVDFEDKITPGDLILLRGYLINKIEKLGY